MEQSILTSTKKVLQIGDDDTSFDLDIITHINSAFSDLHDLGIGPSDGFAIDDDTAEWDAVVAVEDKVRFNRVKTFVYIKVRLIFDPPATTFHLSALQEQLREVTWRLSVGREAIDWVDPLASGLSEPDIYGDSVVLDGGDSAP